MVKHRQLAPTVGSLAKDQQKNPMASFEFSFPAIDTGTTFVFCSWVCIANGSGGFSSHLIDPASTETPRREQLGEITSAEILLPRIAKEIENLSLSDSTPTRFPFGLKNSAMSYSELSRQWDRIGTRTPPLFESYPDSHDDFDLNSDSLGYPNLTILATLQNESFARRIRNLLARSIMPRLWLAYGTCLTSWADLSLQSEEKKLPTLL